MKSLYPYYIYYSSILISVVVAVIRFKQLDLATKVLGVLMIVDFINEISAFWIGIKYGNNMPTNNIHSIIEFVLICLYFNYSIDALMKKRIGYYIAGIGIILGLINMVSIQGITKLNSYFLILEGATIIGLSLFAFFRQLADHDTLRLYRYPHFWFTTILFFFWSSTFFNWVLYDYLNANYLSLSWIFNLSILIVNTLTYLCISCILFLYPKM